MIIVLVSSTRLDTELELELCMLFFQLDICALCPEAVLNLWRDSVKLGPDSILLSIALESFVLFRESFVLLKESFFLDSA